jgi:hypothetical protein
MPSLLFTLLVSWYAFVFVPHACFTHVSFFSFSFESLLQVRLILTLTYVFSISHSFIHSPTHAHSPIVVVLAAVGMSHTLRTFLNPAIPSKTSGVQSVSQEEEKHTDSEGKSEAQHARLVSRALITMLLLFLLSLFVVHSSWVTSTAYSSPSVVLASSVRSYFPPFLNSSLIHFSHHRTAMAVATSWMTSARLISGFDRTLLRMGCHCMCA